MVEHTITLYYKGKRLPDDYVARRVAEALADNLFLDREERVAVGDALYEVINERATMAIKIHP